MAPISHNESEAFACKILRSGRVLYDDFKRLSNTHPSFNSEAFVTGLGQELQGPSLSANFLSLPCCSRLIVELARTMFPDTNFDSVGLFSCGKASQRAASSAVEETQFAFASLLPDGNGKLLLRQPQHDVVLSLVEKPLIVDTAVPFELVDWGDNHDLLLMCFSSSCDLEESHLNALREANLPVMPVSAPQGEQHQLRRDVSQFKSPQKDCGICVEIFAGCARLSVATQKLGFQALAYDHQCKSQFPVQMLDLTCADQAAVLLQIVREHASRLVCIQIAPPCGTCSARLNRRSSCVCVLSSARFSCIHVFFTCLRVVNFSYFEFCLFFHDCCWFSCTWFLPSALLRPTFEPWFS